MQLPTAAVPVIPALLSAGMTHLVCPPDLCGSNCVMPAGPPSVNSYAFSLPLRSRETT